MIPTDYNKELMLNRTVLMTIGAKEAFRCNQNEYGWNTMLRVMVHFGVKRSRFYRLDGHGRQDAGIRKHRVKNFYGDIILPPLCIRGTDNQVVKGGFT